MFTSPLLPIDSTVGVHNQPQHGLGAWQRVPAESSIYATSQHVSAPDTALANGATLQEIKGLIPYGMRSAFWHHAAMSTGASLCKPAQRVTVLLRNAHE